MDNGSKSCAVLCSNLFPFFLISRAQSPRRNDERWFIGRDRKPHGLTGLVPGLWPIRSLRLLWFRLPDWSRLPVPPTLPGVKGIMWHFLIPDWQTSTGGHHAAVPHRTVSLCLHYYFRAGLPSQSPGLCHLRPKSEAETHTHWHPAPQPDHLRSALSPLPTLQDAGSDE